MNLARDQDAPTVPVTNIAGQCTTTTKTGQLGLTLMMNRSFSHYSLLPTGYSLI
ncbi:MULTISPECIES: hypothetical protein [Okeania]|uniref:hypothetical protein n=1 Tax=Okeania TaxID=1458928 RepID=UPI001374D5F2|nr:MULTISPECIES: hypothetical protein [Okeania]NEP04175.1 hypothetical protein [Okeania sp. SIO4D6]NEP40280.1 hypothetical protein [Okeania sp. SIO2H7]NET14806.1 hypothetical protein [Okeania sp. SIO1H6]NET20356.1 hypothetical protein [Okeania sp. SIO1H5]NEP73471.1 hypothetical protein [Okeania sp. SIO2G5]